MPPTGTCTEQAWRTCYREVAPKLLIYARQWTASQADAEDAVQAAFVRFWRRQPDAEPSHYPLLFAAVRTAALDQLKQSERRSRRELASLEGDAAPEPIFQETTLEERERNSQLQAALERIPAEQREALVLRVWGELTFAEIAATLGESINTVSARYRYGLEALRRILKPNEYERV